jgi:hypothetical protein
MTTIFWDWKLLYLFLINYKEIKKRKNLDVFAPIDMLVAIKIFSK